jgi:hypothetical protein
MRNNIEAKEDREGQEDNKGEALREYHMESCREEVL